MIYKLLIFITLLTPFTNSFRQGVSFSKAIEKRLDKNLDRFFDKEAYHRQEIRLHDSILNGTNSFIYFVENNSKSKNAYLVVTIANGCKIGGCDVEHEQDEEFEQFYIYSLFNSKAELLEVKIIDYPSEHGYEVTSKWWLKRFVKYQHESYSYGKNIDAISGATISVKSMIREISYLQKCMPAVISENS